MMMTTAIAPTAQPTDTKSLWSMAMASQDPIAGRVTWVLPTVKYSDATTKNQPPDIDIIVFQTRAGVANGSSSFQNLRQGERWNCWLTSTRSTGSVRSDW